MALQPHLIEHITDVEMQRYSQKIAVGMLYSGLGIAVLTSIHLGAQSRIELVRTEAAFL